MQKRIFQIQNLRENSPERIIQKKLQEISPENFEMSFPPDFFSFPKKMELEDQKKIETCLEIIILTESDLIREKYAKIRQDEQSEHRKTIWKKL